MSETQTQTVGRECCERMIEKLRNWDISDDDKSLTADMLEALLQRSESLELALTRLQIGRAHV